jgi:hypothetical protein
MLIEYDAGAKRNADDFLNERSYVDLIDYISHLANAGLIDNRYLADRIKCDISYVSKIIAPN